jgi:hypothetical protein
LGKDGFKLTLKEIHNESPILTEKPIVYQDFKISPVVVEEWKELLVKVEDSSRREVDKIYFGAKEANGNTITLKACILSLSETTLEKAI